MLNKPSIFKRWLNKGLYTSDNSLPERTEEAKKLIWRNLWLGLATNVVIVIIGLWYSSSLLYGIASTNLIISFLGIYFFFKKSIFLAFDSQVVYFTFVILVSPFLVGWLYAVPMIFIAIYSSILFVYDEREVVLGRYAYFFLLALGGYLGLPLFIDFEVFNWHSLVEYTAIISSFVIIVSSFNAYRNYNISTKQKIRTRQGMLDALLKSSKDIIWAIDPTGVLIACNEPAREELSVHLALETVNIGEKIFTKSSSNIYDEYVPYFKRCLGGEVFELEPQIISNGQSQYYNTRLAPIKDELGKIIGVSIFSRNITELKKANLAIEESDKKYRLIAENTTDVIALHDPTGVFHFVSPSATQITNFELEELIGENANTFIHPEDLPSLSEAFENTYKLEENFEITFRFKTKEGGWVWLESAMTPVFDDAGEIKYIQITSRDVTEKLHIQHMVDQRNQIINKLIHLQPVIFYRFKKNGEIVESVGQGLKKLGLKPNEIVGANIYELYSGYPEVIESHRKVLDELFISYQTQIKVGDNQVIYYDTKVSYDPVLEEGVGLSFDVSDQFTILNQLKESEARFRKFFEHSPLGVAIRDLETGRFLAVNEKMQSLTGFSKLDFIGAFREGMTVWEDTKDYNQQLKNLLDGKVDGFQNQKLFKRKNGSSFWGRVHRTFFEIEGAKYLVGFVEDIDEELEAKQRLVQSEKQYRLLFENAFDGLIIYDGKTLKAIDCNERTLKYFKVKDKEAFLKTHPLELCPEVQPNGKPSKELLHKYVQKALQTGESSYEWQHRLKDGSILYTEVSILEIPLPNQKRFISIFRDITEKKRQEVLLRHHMLELNDKNEKLQKYIDSNLQLENFAYMASHDMKAPLRTIISFSQLLEKKVKGKLNERELDYLSFIVKATNNLYSLINGLLAYSKVDANKAILQEVNFKELVTNTLKELHSIIEEKDALVYVKNLPEKLWCDKIQLKQLVQNLVGNALKFSKPNLKPEILIEGKDNGDKWEIRIEDNGIGIDAKYHERIFLLFRRLHTNDQIEGTGIGLALCKKIVDQHNGTIKLKSHPGKGTTFFIQLPKRELILQD